MAISSVPLRKRSKRFVANGSWVCPPGVYEVKVEIIGGGGGGGGSHTPTALVGGGGGGSGCYTVAEVTVTPGTTYWCTVGAGGTGGYYNQPSTNGGESSFYESSIYPSYRFAAGGNRGINGWGESNLNGGAGGAGGAGGGAGACTVSTNNAYKKILGGLSFNASTNGFDSADGIRGTSSYTFSGNGAVIFYGQQIQNFAAVYSNRSGGGGGGVFGVGGIGGSEAYGGRGGNGYYVGSGGGGAASTITESGGNGAAGSVTIYWEE